MHFSYVWRIDLSRTERYWTGWFQGLSTAFLECTAPKLLLLASISGLDRELTVGQMQGEYSGKFKSFALAGYFITMCVSREIPNAGLDEVRSRSSRRLSRRSSAGDCFVYASSQIHGSGFSGAAKLQRHAWLLNFSLNA